MIVTDLLFLETYQRVCGSVPKEGEHDGNHPLDFEMLSEPEQQALLYWISKAMRSASKYDDRSSYGLKHDFEAEGFYITNGQFKGAMLLSGYMPKDEQELNWIFEIRKVYTRKIYSGGRDDLLYQSRYSIAGFDREYAQLLLKAGHLQD